MTARRIFGVFVLSGVVTLCGGLLGATVVESATAPLIKVQIDAKRRAVRAGRFHVASDRVSIVLLGDSRVASGLIPSDLDRLLSNRTSSLNLALPRHGMSRFLYQLQDYVHVYGAPAYIVLVPNFETGTRGERIDGATLPEMFDYIWQDGASWHPVGFGLRGIGLRDLGRFTSLYQLRQTDVAQMIREQGVFWWANRGQALGDDFTARPNAVAALEEVAWFSPEAQAATYRFLDYAHTIGTRVLLTAPPVRLGAAAPLSTVPQYVTDILSRYPNVRQAPEAWRRRFYPNGDFFDRGHLNEVGARKFTAEVAAELREAFPEAFGAQ